MARLLLRTLKKRFSSSGFTLIEVMVGMLLLLVATAGIVPVLLTGLSQASSVRYKSIANNIAREQLEKVRQLDYREIVSDTQLDTLFGTTESQRGIPFTIQHHVANATYDGGTLKQVTVTVTWTAPPKVSAASATTLIHQQFLGPRGAWLEITPTQVDPLGSPFPWVYSNMTTIDYHLAQADWGLVYSDFGQPGMARLPDPYVIFKLVDSAGRSSSLEGPSTGESKADYSHLSPQNGNGTVVDVRYGYQFDAGAIPDGYWELQATAYNAYAEPGNTWRQMIRIENGPPAAPTGFVAYAQANNQSVVLEWTNGPERDRAYIVVQRQKLDPDTGWPADWTTIAGNLPPDSSTYTDTGDVANQTDPWGSGDTSNTYRYRVYAVDKCQPGLAGSAATADVVIPAVVSTTTTTMPTTSTTTPTSTSTTSTTLGSGITIHNTTNQTWTIKIKNSSGTVVYSGSVDKNSTATAGSLPPDTYQIHATGNGHNVVDTSRMLPAQSGDVVTIT